MQIPHDKLQDIAARIFAAAGCSDSEAECIGRRLVEANLVGHDSHGVLRIPFYVQWLQEGKVLADQTIDVVLETDILAVVDGRYGFGQSIGEQAVQLGIDKSTKHGISVIALRNTGHLGRIGDWPQMAADAGILSLHFVNTSGMGMLVAPFGGIERRLSANPIAIGVPRENAPALILDISACTIAEGKIKVALNKGVTVPDGCLIDSKGNPTNDPKVFYADPPGSILPIAAHKGYGLSFMSEMLAGAMTGGGCTNPQNSDRLANGMFSIYLNPTAFSESDAFYSEVTRFVEFVKSSQTISPDGEILVPGEIESRNRAERVANGIELDETTWQQIEKVCESLNIAL